MIVASFSKDTARCIHLTKIYINALISYVGTSIQSGRLEYSVFSISYSSKATLLPPV